MSNRRNVAPVARWLLAALALAALAARATAAPKKVTVYSCQDVDDAFRVLGGMAANATTSSPISLTITYACNGARAAPAVRGRRRRPAAQTRPAHGGGADGGSID